MDTFFFFLFFLLFWGSGEGILENTMVCSLNKYKSLRVAKDLFSYNSKKKKKKQYNSSKNENISDLADAGWATSPVRCLICQQMFQRRNSKHTEKTVCFTKCFVAKESYLPLLVKIWGGQGYLPSANRLFFVHLIGQMSYQGNISRIHFFFNFQRTVAN